MNANKDLETQNDVDSLEEFCSLEQHDRFDHLSAVS